MVKLTRSTFRVPFLPNLQIIHQLLEQFLSLNSLQDIIALNKLIFGLFLSLNLLRIMRLKRHDIYLFLLHFFIHARYFSRFFIFKLLQNIQLFLNEGLELFFNRDQG